MKLSPCLLVFCLREHVVRAIIPVPCAGSGRAVVSSQQCFEGSFAPMRAMRWSADTRGQAPTCFCRFETNPFTPAQALLLVQNAKFKVQNCSVACVEPWHSQRKLIERFVLNCEL